MKLKKLLGSQAYWTINKQLAKTIGLKATLLLQHLIDLEDSFFNGTYFYQQADRLSKDLGLSLFQIRNAKKVLIKYDLIEVVLRGVPAKDHFKLHEDKIFNLLTSTCEESETLEIKKVNDKDKESIETKNQVKPNNIKDNKLSSSIAEASEDLNLENFESVKEIWSKRIGDEDQAFYIFYNLSNKQQTEFISQSITAINHGIIPITTRLSDYLEDWSEEN
jgi:hypothetical protein